MARGLNLPILEEEGLYYLCNKNKGADQLCSHRAADLCLFHMQKVGFSLDATQFIFTIVYELVFISCKIKLT